MTGWSRQEAMAPDCEVSYCDSVNRRTHPNPMAMALGETARCICRPTPFSSGATDRKFPIEDSVAPIHDRQGQATGAVIVLRDVSAARENGAANGESAADSRNKIRCLARSTVN